MLAEPVTWQSHEEKKFWWELINTRISTKKRQIKSKIKRLADVAEENRIKCQPEYETLHFERGASDFETLRLATEKSDKQPVVFMLTIGNLAMRLARSQFSGNFFGCAGYKIVDNLGFNTIQEGVDAAIEAKADIVVLCSSDDEYATLAPEAKAALGDKAILVVAGAPECMEELKAQGIDQFINVRSNVLDTLKAFNAKLSIH